MKNFKPQDLIEKELMAAMEGIDGYADPRMQTLEDLVISKIRKDPDFDDDFKDEVIGDIQMEGIEEFMGFELYDDGKFVSNPEMAQVLDSKETMEKAADDYISALKGSYLGSADENFVDEHIGIAEEAFPKALIDKEKQRRLEYVYDENGDIVRNPDGTRKMVVNKKRLAEALKEWGRIFADHGVSIDGLNFDDYLVQGVSIDKYPRDSLTCVLYKDEFIICDTRKDYKGQYEGGLWQAHTIRMQRNRDGRYVDLYKIPDSQILGGASMVWVIPASDILDPSDLIKKRRAARAGSIDRMTEEKIYDYNRSSRWSRGDRYADKSGYIVDPGLLKRRLDEYRVKKAGDPQTVYTKASDTLLKLTQTYNDFMKEALALFGSVYQNGLTNNGDGTVEDIGDNLFSYASRIKDNIRDWSSKITRFGRMINNGEKDPREIDYYKAELVGIIADMGKFWNRGERTYGDYLKESLEKLRDTVRGLSSDDNGATESSVPRSIMKAFDEE